MDAWTAGRMRISLLRGLSMVGRAEKEKREALLSFYVLAVVGCGVGGANREPDIHATRMWIVETRRVWIPSVGQHS